MTVLVHHIHSPSQVPPLKFSTTFLKVVGSGPLNPRSVCDGYREAIQETDFQPDDTHLFVTETGVAGVGGPPHAPVGLIEYHQKGFPVTPPSLTALAKAFEDEAKKMSPAEIDLGIAESKQFRRFIHSVKAAVAQNQSGCFNVKVEVYKMNLQHAGASIDIFPLLSSPSSRKSSKSIPMWSLHGLTLSVVSTADFNMLLTAAGLTAQEVSDE